MNLNSHHYHDASTRWRVIGFLEGGGSICDASRFYKIDKSSVSRIWSRFRETGSVEDRPRGGRPKKITTPVKDEVISKLNEKYSSAYAIASQMALSKTSIYNIAHEAGMAYRFYEEIPRLTQFHKDKRLEYALTWKDKDLDHIVFTDEVYFHLFRNTMGTWTSEKKVYVERINPNRALMAWAGISMKGKTKICIKDFGYKINADAYIGILEDYLLPFRYEHYEDGYMYLMQDNARPHVAKRTREWLDSNIAYVLPHPAYSPDLNPIEHLWSVVKYELEKEEPKTLEELRFKIEKAWDTIPLSRIQACIQNLRKRLHESSGAFV